MASRPRREATRAFRMVPLTAKHWDAFELLFGERGACGGCWCMTPRLSASEYARRKGEGNRRAMKHLVGAGGVPGLLGFRGSEPVGWVSIEPREAFPRLGRSRVLAPVDDEPVWSIVCLFVAKSHRRTGVSVRLLRGAVDWARSQGARIVEGYPVEPVNDTVPDVFAWTGLASAFRAAGFSEALRRSDTRPIMRRSLRPRTGR